MAYRGDVCFFLFSGAEKYVSMYIHIWREDVGNLWYGDLKPLFIFVWGGMCGRYVRELRRFAREPIYV